MTTVGREWRTMRSTGSEVGKARRKSSEVVVAASTRDAKTDGLLPRLLATLLGGVIVRPLDVVLILVWLIVISIAFGYSL